MALKFNVKYILSLLIIFTLLLGFSGSVFAADCKACYEHDSPEDEDFGSPPCVRVVSAECSAEEGLVGATDAPEGANESLDETTLSKYLNDDGYEEYRCNVKADLSSGEVTSLVGSENVIFGKGDPVLIKNPVTYESTDEGVLCVYSSFKNIVNLIKFGILIISVIVFSIAGVLYATARDDTKKRDQAKSYIFSGVVGLILTLVAHIIPSLVIWAF